jgi:hypothetical protein
MNLPTASELDDLWPQLQQEQDAKDKLNDVIDLTQDNDDEDQRTFGQGVFSDHVKHEPTDAMDCSATDVDDDSAPIQDVFSVAVPSPAATSKPSGNRVDVG